MARPRTHDESVRRRLLEHASEAIATGGPGALSVRTVADAAGTTTAAVYSLFGSRAALLQAVAAEGFRRFANHLAGAPRTGDPAADLFALGLAYRESALGDPHFYRVMFAQSPAWEGSGPPGPPGDDTTGDPGGRGPRAAGARPTFVVLRDAVAAVLDAVGLDVAGAEEVALRLWALAHGLVSLELAGLLPGTPAERAGRYAAALRATPFEGAARQA